MDNGMLVVPHDLIPADTKKLKDDNFLRERLNYQPFLSGKHSYQDAARIIVSHTDDVIQSLSDILSTIRHNIMKEGGNCYITEVIERYNRAGGRVGKGQELKSIEDIATLIENMKNKPLEAITMALDNVFSISTDSSNFVTNVLYAELTRKLGSGELCGSRHLKMVFPKHGLKKAQQGKKGNKTIHSVLSVGNAGSENTKKTIQRYLMHHLGITIRVKEPRRCKDNVTVQWNHEGRAYQLLISKRTLQAKGVNPSYFDHLTQEHVKNIFDGGSVGGALRSFVSKAKSSQLSREQAVQMVHEAYDKNTTYGSPSGYVPAIPGVELDSPRPTMDMVNHNCPDYLESLAARIFSPDSLSCDTTQQYALEHEEEQQSASRQDVEELAARKAELAAQKAAEEELAARKAEEEVLAARKAEEEKELEAQELAAKAAAANQPAATKLAAQKAAEKLAAQKTATETRRLVRWVGDGRFYAVKEIVGRKFLQKSKVWKYEVEWEEGGQRDWVLITDFHDTDLWQEYDRVYPREKQVCLASYSNSIIFSNLILISILLRTINGP
jgi:chemotaxis protein histidine kinase CheA